MRMLMILAILAAGLGCKKVNTGSATVATDSGPKGASDTNYVAGGGAIQNSRRAADRIKVDAELQQLGQLMEVQYNELGRMPKPEEIKDYLTQSQGILGHITKGNIVLTGTKDHAGLWAYQAEADTLGGLALVAGVANKYSADDIRKLKAGN